MCFFLFLHENAVAYYTRKHNEVGMCMYLYAWSCEFRAAVQTDTNARCWQLVCHNAIASCNFISKMVRSGWYGF